MKKIAVFFKLPGAMDEPFSKGDYFTAYSELSEEVSALGGQFYIVRDQKTYLGNGSFSRSWIIENGDLTETGPVTVEVIYNKGKFISDGTIPIFNCERITKECDNKWTMYQRLSQYCPLTFFAETASQLKKNSPKNFNRQGCF